MREDEKGVFLGIGFGPIQAGLFLLEARDSGAFRRLVVSEIDRDTVRAVREAGGQYVVNVARLDGIEARRVAGIEIYNPRDPADREPLREAVAEATEMATALPSVKFYDDGTDVSPAALIAAGARRKKTRSRPPAILYAAENTIYAARSLEECLRRRGVDASRVYCVDTVIGKMSGSVSGRKALREGGLAPFVPGSERAFRVESFNRILVGRIPPAPFRRRISVFEEKEDLLPFEEAKLFGHNAIHALLGYLLAERGREWMSDAAEEPDLLDLARQALLRESGAALCRKHRGVDPLFTPEGFRAYAEALLPRMINPHLRDAVERIIRDPERKLGWNDRLVGAIRLALAGEIEPRRLAIGAAAALRRLARERGVPPDEVLDGLWREDGVEAGERARVIERIRSAPSA